MNNRALIYGLAILSITLGFLVLQSSLVLDRGPFNKNVKSTVNKETRTVSAKEFAELLRNTQRPHSGHSRGADTEERNLRNPKHKIKPKNRPDSSVLKRREARLKPPTVKLLNELDIKPLSPGTESPNFVLKRVSGDTIALSHYRNQWVLLNFWATWCMPCREEMPSLNRLNNRFPETVTILGVNIGGDKNKVRSFSEKYNINFPLFLDRRGRIASIFGTKFLPETWLIGPRGKIFGVAKGPRDWSSQSMVDLFSHLTEGN